MVFVDALLTGNELLERHLLERLATRWRFDVGRWAPVGEVVRPEVLLEKLNVHEGGRGLLWHIRCLLTRLVMSLKLAI